MSLGKKNIKKLNKLEKILEKNKDMTSEVKKKKPHEGYRSSPRNLHDIFYIGFIRVKDINGKTILKRPIKTRENEYNLTSYITKMRAITFAYRYASEVHREFPLTATVEIGGFNKHSYLVKSLSKEYRSKREGKFTVKGNKKRGIKPIKTKMFEIKSNGWVDYDRSEYLNNPVIQEMLEKELRGDK